MHRAPVVALLLAANLAIAGCVNTDTPPLTDQDVPFETLVEGNSSGIDDRRTLVIRSEDAWATLWDAHGQNQLPPPERPDVDFATHWVVAVFKGDSPDGCNGATIQNITRLAADGAVHVTGWWITGVRDAFCTQVQTQPHHMVTIAHVDGAFVFDMEDKELANPDA